MTISRSNLPQIVERYTIWDAFVITDLLWLLVGLALSEQSEALPLASRQGHQGRLVLAAH